MFCIFSVFKALNHHVEFTSAPIIHQRRKIHKTLMATSLYTINWLHKEEANAPLTDYSGGGGGGGLSGGGPSGRGGGS
jgi:uncharacterized membrane protein